MVNFFIETLCSLSMIFHSNAGTFGHRNRSNLVSHDLFYIEVLRFRLDDHLPDLLLLN